MWQVIDPHQTYSPVVLQSKISSYFGEDTLVELHSPATGPNTFPFYRQHAIFSLAYEYPTPLSSLDELRNFDPLQPLTRLLDFLHTHRDERVLYSLVVRTQTFTASDHARNRIKQGRIPELKTWPIWKPSKSGSSKKS